MAFYEQLIEILSVQYDKQLRIAYRKDLKLV
jgi:hypothetical protein